MIAACCMIGAALLAADVPSPGEVSFSFNLQGEFDRRTPAHLQVRAGESLHLRVWVSAEAPAWIPEPVESFVSLQIRDAAGRTVHAQGSGGQPRGAPRPRSTPPGGARNFYLVALPRCHAIPAGVYTLELRYSTPAADRMHAYDLTARTVLEIQPAPPMPQRHLDVEVLPVGISEDFRGADGQIIVHNDGCETVECSMLPPGRLRIVVRDRQGRTVCEPDGAKSDRAQDKDDVATVPPGQGVGLGLGWARCDPEAVRRAGPIESLRARVRYDSKGLPGWRLSVDQEVAVEIRLVPHSAVPSMAPPRPAPRRGALPLAGRARAVV